MNVIGHLRSTVDFIPYFFVFKNERIFCGQNDVKWNGKCIIWLPENV